MDKHIEQALERTEFNTQGELDSFIKETQVKIAKYEKLLYLEDGFDKEKLEKVKKWRVKLFRPAKQNKELPVKEDKEEKEGLEALKMLNRQVDLADKNQKILNKSTLKVLSLNYSSKELENAIVETSKMIEKSMSKEKQEERRMILMFLVFIGVCLVILLDKIQLKFLK